MCGLHAYDKNNDTSTNATKFGGGIPLQADSKINPIVSLCVRINFIDTWIFALEINFAWRCCAYQNNTK